MTLQLTSAQLGLPLSLGLRFALKRFRHAVLRFASVTDTEAATLERDFMALLARENANISRICFSYAGSVADFDDLRQDALINIWRGMKSFRGQSSERTWVYRVTINSCLSTIRKQSRHRHESLEKLYGLIETDEPEREAIEQMHRAIAVLGLEDKAIIMMWLDEMSYDDIAEAMGMNRNTVATRLRRIKEKIAKQYQKEENI